MKIEIILPYPGLTTTKGTILDAQDEEMPEDVTATIPAKKTSDGNTGDTSDEQAG